jgi:hypothetical protein
MFTRIFPNFPEMFCWRPKVKCSRQSNYVILRKSFTQKIARAAMRLKFAASKI